MPPRPSPSNRPGLPQRQRQGPSGPVIPNPVSQRPPQLAKPPALNHVLAVGVKRPDYGSKGRQIDIKINAFETAIPEAIIYQYKGDISCRSPLHVEVVKRLIATLQKNAPVLANTPIAFDGHTIFSISKLNLGETQTGEFEVEGRKIVLSYATETNTTILKDFVYGLSSYSNDVSTNIRALNVALRMAPLQNCVTRGSFLFNGTDTLDIGGGMVLWRGYFQSIRPATQRLLINVDVSAGVMYKPGRLMDLCLEVLRWAPGSHAALGVLKDREWHTLSRFVTGILIRQRGETRDRVVQGLSKEDAASCKIKHDGLDMDLATYYGKLSQPLRFPKILCAKVGKEMWIPLELCDVIGGQHIKIEVPEDKQRDFIKFSTMKPEARQQHITSGLNVLKYDESQTVDKFGLRIGSSLFATTARILSSPSLKYRNNQQNLPVRIKASLLMRSAHPTDDLAQDGQWNMYQKQFYIPVTIKRWVLVVFAPSRVFDTNNVDEVKRNFVEGCQRTGINFTGSTPLIVSASNILPSEIIPTLDQAEATCRETYNGDAPSLFLIVLPDDGECNFMYTIVKHWGDVKIGIPTQCLKASKGKNAKAQFWANIALKINAKLGGTNAVLDTSVPLLSLESTTIVMGADVMHPGAGSSYLPSYAALVASIDPMATKYVATSSVQPSRQELIADLEPMTIALLSRFMRIRKIEPTALILYRDGVSEGQFKRVLNEELPLVKAACKAVKINPKITLIVVGKRHHVRLFPTGYNDADRSGNCPAGTVVDRAIVNPVDFDFYLQSHGGILGTSRPAHYSVLYDDNRLKADDTQTLSFALCHVYASSTRAISIPAPVYYADAVCSRAKNHFDPFTPLKASKSDTLAEYRQNYKPLHPTFHDRMYFS
ncbi:argonaute-like protein [Mycena polygramma]|nr:argonaute-like protein [Mycena polygramma]